MSNKSNKHPRPPSAGITLVEILMVISVLVIALSFAVPSVGKATARAEVKSAAQHIEHAISAARNLARASESPVSLHIESDREGQPQVLGLSNAANEPVVGWQAYVLPDSVQAVADQEAYVFDAWGLVENPGQVLLVAREDQDIQAEIALH